MKQISDFMVEKWVEQQTHNVEQQQQEGFDS